MDQALLFDGFPTPTLEETIDAHIACLADLYRQANQTVDGFDREFSEIERQLCSCEITRSDLEDQWTGYAIPPATDLFSVPFLQACVYTILSRKACHKQDLNRSWSYIAHARHLSGMVSTGLWVKHVEAEVQRKSDTGRAGARAKNAKYDPAIQKAIELLVENRPPGGWPSKKAAAREIEKDMDTFNKANHIPIHLDSLHERLRQWMTKKPDVRAAFHGNDSKNT